MPFEKILGVDCWKSVGGFIECDIQNDASNCNHSNYVLGKAVDEVRGEYECLFFSRCCP